MLLQYLFLMLLDGAFGAETDETVSVMEGDSVTLHTNLTEVLNDDTILWLFGRKDSIISQITRKQDLTSFFVTDDARFRGRLQVDQKTGTLTIRKTRIKHSGQYKLTVSRKQTTTKIFNVTVIDVVGETDGVKSVSVMEGDPVTLQCDVSEVQRDDLIVWRFGDKGLLLAKIDVESNETLLNDADERFRDRLKLSESRSLTIKKTRTTDSGLYEVQIRGSESSQRFLLSVSAVPDSGLSPGFIAGIVLAVLLVAAVVAAVVIYYRRKISELQKQVVMKVSVVKGGSVTLETRTKIQRADEILWTFGAENCLVVRADPRITIGERFTGRLKLDEKTGSLSIRNIKTADSGHFKLQIINSEKTTFRRFNVSVTESTGKQVNESAAVEMPLLNRENVDGVNE
uniref:Ig-like domain-containing protein n=1 Tax=Cyprinus carpio carpio TaxID=630221 RepID=A0A8C1H8H8_CYPCA